MARLLIGVDVSCIARKRAALLPSLRMISLSKLLFFIGSKLWINVIKDFAVCDAEVMHKHLLTYDAYLPVHAVTVKDALQFGFVNCFMRLCNYSIVTVAAFNFNLFAGLVNHNVSSHAIAVVLGEKNWECHLFCVFIDLRF
jgi:hypothetical protein